MLPLHGRELQMSIVFFTQARLHGHMVIHWLFILIVYSKSEWCWIRIQPNLHHGYHNRLAERGQMDFIPSLWIRPTESPCFHRVASQTPPHLRALWVPLSTISHLFFFLAAFASSLPPPSTRSWLSPLLKFSPSSWSLTSQAGFIIRSFLHLRFIVHLWEWMQRGWWRWDDAEDVVLLLKEGYRSWALWTEISRASCQHINPFLCVSNGVFGKPVTIRTSELCGYIYMCVCVCFHGHRAQPQCWAQLKNGLCSCWWLTSFQMDRARAVEAEN